MAQRARKKNESGNLKVVQRRRDLSTTSTHVVARPRVRAPTFSSSFPSPSPPSTLAVKPKSLPAKFPSMSDTGSAPAAVSTTQHRSFSMMGNLFTGLTVRLCEPFASVIIPGSATYDQGGGSFQAFSNTCTTDGKTVAEQDFYVTSLNPLRGAAYASTTSSPSYWQNMLTFPDGQFLQQIAGVFSRYRVKGGVTFHYRPMCATTTSVNFQFSVVGDPAHRLIGVNSGIASFPTLNTQLLSPTCMSFAAWLPWSATFPIDNTPKFTFEPSNALTGAQTTSNYFASAELRQSDFGAVVCLSNLTATGTSSVKLGEMYWEYEVEFMDPSPLVAFDFIQPYLLKTRSEPEVKKESKEEKKTLPPAVVTSDDEFEDPSPSAYCPPPSKAPGGSLYSPPSPSSSSSSSSKSSSLAAAGVPAARELSVLTVKIPSRK